MIAITISSDGFQAKIQRITSLAKNPRAVMVAGAREGANLLRRHFREKNQKEPNKLGGRRSKFWDQVARSVSAPVVENEKRVAISITDPRFAQKLFGGTITAKRVKNLAIPQEPEAYGRAPAVFEKETGLKLIFIRQRGNGLLATRRSLSSFLQVEYLLKPSVHQNPDPTALPPQKELERVVVERAEEVLSRQLKQP